MFCSQKLILHKIVHQRIFVRSLFRVATFFKSIFNPVAVENLHICFEPRREICLNFTFVTINVFNRSPPSPSKIHIIVYVEDSDIDHSQSIVADTISNKSLTLICIAICTRQACRVILKSKMAIAPKQTQRHLLGNFNARLLVCLKSLQRVKKKNESLFCSQSHETDNKHI